jgi:hypothetical protein
MFSKQSSNRILRAVVLPIVFSTGLANAQPKPVTPRPTPVTRAAAPAAPSAPISDKDLAATQEELIRLLRLSPTLTTVVEHDPTLLSNGDYVRRNNPQLAQFLDSHPEIALNPDFYLFTHLKERDGSPDQALERAVWPELREPYHEPSTIQWLVNEVGPFVVFVCVLLAALWLFRQFVENRRWGRIFKLQMDVHSKLIDKFGSNEQLLVYMDTEAGKRFLEAAPIPVDFESDQRVPNVVARVLTPLQIGIVLSLLGLGFLSLRHVHRDMDVPMLLMGTVMLMPGIGFILSAGITWVLAGRLGLMPDADSGHGGARNGRPYPSYQSSNQRSYPSPNQAGEVSPIHDPMHDPMHDRLDTRDRQ